MTSPAGSTPPVPILAPVAGLISVSSPNASGNSRILGIPGSVQAGAQVQLTNASTQESVTATADNDGAFSAQIAAGVGNAVSIVQSVENAASEASQSVIPRNVPPLSAPAVATSVDPVNHLGFSASTDGADTTVDFFNLSDADDVALILEQGEIVLPGIAATDFEYDPAQEAFYVVDNANDQFEMWGVDGAQMGAAIPLENPLSVVRSDQFFAAAIGQESATTPITLIEVNGGIPSVFNEYQVSHPTDGGAQHVKTYALSTDIRDSGTGVSYLHIGALSVFSNGDTVFTLLHSHTGAAVVRVNLGQGVFGGLKVFNDGTEAMITDTANDRVIHLSSTDANGLFDRTTTVAVGDAPVGIDAEDDLTGLAVVANSRDNTASLIVIANDEVLETPGSDGGIGLNPVDVTLDFNLAQDVFIALIANGDGETVTVFDAEPFLN